MRRGNDGVKALGETSRPAALGRAFDQASPLRGRLGIPYFNRSKLLLRISQSFNPLTFSIGGNHFNHTARKNIKMTYVVMDNWVYGLTKKQTSPTSPLGFKSKTDTWGAVDYPINPMKQAIAAGATFVARTTHTNPSHVLQMMEAAMDHEGFSFIECLSECVEFYEGAFDASNPRKGGVFNQVSAEHDVTDEMAAYKLSDAAFPGYFGLFYKADKPTKNAKEASLNAGAMEKVKGLKDWQILQKTFDRLK